MFYFALAINMGISRKESKRGKIFWGFEDKGPYYKSELELKSNSNEILPVNCKLICVFTPTKTDKTQT